MAGKYVKHKLHEEWGIGKVQNDSEIIKNKIQVHFQTHIEGLFVKKLVNAENLITVGFYD